MTSEELEKRRAAVLKDIADWQREDPGRNTDAALSRAANISGSAISQIKRGIYGGRMDKMLDLLEAHFELLRQRLAVNLERRFSPTSNGRSVLGFVNIVHVCRGIGVIHGGAGIGKTMALLNYCDNTPATAYLQVNPIHRSMKQFLRSLLDALNLRHAANAAEMFSRVKEAASQRGTLIVLDDIQSIFSDGRPNTTILEIIRALNDADVAFILAGNRTLAARVTRNEMESLYEQFTSRAYIMAVPDVLPREDLEAVLENLFGNRLEEKLVDALFDIATRHHGSLRLALRIATQAALRANAQRTALTARHIMDASRLMMSEVKPQFRNQKIAQGVIDVKKTGGGNNPEPEEISAPVEAPGA